MKQNVTLHIIFWAFILHTAWEFAQCVFLYDMWDWTFWKATIWMWAAVFGDILIVLGLWKTAASFSSLFHFQMPRFKDYAFLLSLSFVASILLEWLARALDLWHYSSNMPSFELFNYQVGLSPILQITFLPALSVFLAKKSTMIFNHNKK